MKVVLLLAGRGSRFLPWTRTTPKPLLPVAGAPVLDHILARLRPLPVDELIAVTGYLGGEIEAYLRAGYPGSYRIVEQTRLNGTGGAVHATIAHIDAPVLIIFGDSIFDADLSHLVKNPDQNVIWTQTVEDYQRFGIVQTDSRGDMKVIVEKPRADVGRKANIGVYYLSDHKALRESLDRVMSGPSVNGEYYFTYALNDMVATGRQIRVHDVSGWHDCGDLASMLSTNRQLLTAAQRQSAVRSLGVRVVEPAIIDDSAELQDCRVGPNVTVGAGARIVSSDLSDAIVGQGCQLEKVVVRRAMIGDGERLTGVDLEGLIAANGEIVEYA